MVIYVLIKSAVSLFTMVLKTSEEREASVAVQQGAKHDGSDSGATEKATYCCLG